MTRDVVVCQPGDWLTRDLVDNEGARVEEHSYYGSGFHGRWECFNARDALQVLLEEVENEESLLRDYVMCVGYH